MIALEVSVSSPESRRAQDLDPRFRNALRAAIARGLDAVATDARANVLALRDPTRLGPSLLAESIRTEVDRDGAGGVVRAGGDIAPYAVFVEFGTTHAPAQPFLGPALAMNAGRIRADIGSAMTNALGDGP